MDIWIIKPVKKCRKIILKQISGTVIDSSADNPTTILVKLTEDGQTIIMQEDSINQATEDMQVGGETEVVSTVGNSDEVTNAAVKSILSDSGKSNFRWFSAFVKNQVFVIVKNVINLMHYNWFYICSLEMKY